MFLHQIEIDEHDSANFSLLVVISWNFQGMSMTQLSDGFWTHQFQVQTHKVSSFDCMHLWKQIISIHVHRGVNETQTCHCIKGHCWVAFNGFNAFVQGDIAQLYRIISQKVKAIVVHYQIWTPIFAWYINKANMPCNSILHHYYIVNVTLISQ